MTIPPTRAVSDANHVPDHNDIRGELVTNKAHRDVTDGNPHGTTAAMVGAAATSHGTHLPVPTLPDDENKVPVVQSGGGYALAAQSGGVGSPLEVVANGVSLSEAVTALKFVKPSSLSVTESSGEISISSFAPGLRTTTSRLHFPTTTGNLASFGVYQRLYFIPFFGNGMILNSVSTVVDVGAAAGLVRTGLYTGYTTGQLDRIADYGTTDASSGPGLSNNTPDQLLTEGSIYFIAVAIQGAAAVKLRGGNYVLPMQSFNLEGSPQNPAAIYYQDGVSGSLPAISYAPYSGTVTYDGIPLFRATMSDPV